MNKINSEEHNEQIISDVRSFLEDVSSNKRLKKSSDLRVILDRFLRDGCFRSRLDYNFIMRFYKVDRKHYKKEHQHLIKDLSRFKDQMIEPSNTRTTLENFFI
jgi:hypothetical protein